MKNVLSLFPVGLLLACVSLPSIAETDNYSDTIGEFKKTPQVQTYFDSAYAYALYPTVAKGGIGIGAAYGEGRVYKGGDYVGDTKMTQVSIGFQLGGQAYSELIFIKDATAYEEFTSGTLELSAEASAVAITLGANAQVGTTGNSASVGNAGNGQKATADYINGLAIFTAAKGGLMYEAAVAGQAFSYKDK